MIPVQLLPEFTSSPLLRIRRWNGERKYSWRFGHTALYVFFFFGSIMQSKRYDWVSSDAWISNVSLFSYFLMDYLKHWQKSLCINPSSLLLNNYTHHHVPGALLIFDDIRTRTQNSFSCFLFFSFSSPHTPSKLYSGSHEAAHNASPADSPPRSRNKIPPHPLRRMKIW